MVKRLFCLLLSLVMLMSAAFALAEDAADTAAETETAEVLSDEPVLLVTVNGEEIRSDEDYLTYMQSQYLNWAASNGYDTTDAALISAVNQQSLYETMGYYVVLQKGREQGLDQFTEEEKAAFGVTAVEQWNEIVDSFMSGTVTDESSEEDKAAARAETEALLLSSYGYDETRYIQEYVAQAMKNTTYQRVTDSLSAGVEVTEEDIRAYYDDLVSDDREIYANDAATYEFYTQYYGYPAYYMPEGYRGITHILLEVDDELMNNWKDLSARLEEQKSAAEGETPAGEEGSAEGAEPTAEPVTEEMVSAAEEAILESVKATVDEIRAKLEDGASFEDLITEYGKDPGMMDDATRAVGYPVHNDSIRYDPAFKNAAITLEKVGDISEPVVGQNGVHILHYLCDIPGGAAELTDEMRDEIRETLRQNKITEAVHTAVEQWMEESEIVYTEAGEAWKLAETEAAEAEKAEETEEAPAE